MHHFQITAIDPDNISDLFGMTDQELHAINALRMTVDAKPGFPCRVSLADAEVGEEVVLFNFTHHEVGSPYRASGPVFVRKTAKPAELSQNELPKHLGHRLLSLRGYSHEALLVDACTIQGEILGKEIQRFFDDPAVQYIHVHNASQGCYHCQVNRLQ